MSMLLSNTWGLPLELHDGHRLFHVEPRRELADGKPLMAIADHSGQFPQDCEDGILWLDYSRSLMLGNGVAKIPLHHPDSSETWTPSDPATIMWLAAYYEWPINVNGIAFDVKQIHGGKTWRDE